jgi:soluble lytic murein transglycosylase-like protein
MSRSAAGQPVYSNEPQAGSTLLMSLPAVTVRAAYVLDRRSGILQRYPQRKRGAGEPSDPVIRSLIEQAAHRHRLDVALLRALIRQESGFNPLAVSSTGARGLMQLMPDTARRYGVKRLHDPGQNIAGGSAYLRDLLNRFGRLDFALAAYNAGEGAVQKHSGIPPFRETVDYVQTIMAEYSARKRMR